MTAGAGRGSAHRATDGKRPLPVPYDTVDIRLTLKDGVMRTYINGMLDQTVTLRSNNRNY